ncbi:cation:proton antiporter [Sulfuracidifex tepidarius]|uniref:Cation/H+ exchanger transmembrane domain-containing protein n=1 Tax=Sulfuracidifex tepidarius TaxID=1294262 RepID=A0A510E627_9CREN|nr:cation:proton antiporter [Sulfuracidifex tepidarius]BBG27991.1 hypothetical protein IC007_2546 [Sulfuracidifex tepidarius]
MDSNAGLTLVLLIAGGLGLVLSRIKISPVVAYLLAGFLGKTLGFSYPPDLFNFLTLLATGLVSFEIGATLDVKNLRATGRRVTFTVLIESSIVLIAVFLTSKFLDISLIQTVMIGIIGVDSSTSIVYKMSERRVDPKDRSFMLAVSSVEDVMVFVLFSSLLGESVIYTVFFSIASLMIGIGISKYFIRYNLSLGTESVILSAVSSIFFFNLISGLVDIPSSLGSFILGLSVASAVNNAEKVVESLKGIRDFSLIFFFIIAGTYFQFSWDALPFLFVLIALKYFAFSFATWITGDQFLKAFRLGLYMTPLSEFGLILSMNAMSLGYQVPLAYDVSTLVITGSSTISSILVLFERTILKGLSRVSQTQLVTQTDYVIRSLSARDIKIRYPYFLAVLTKFSFYSIALLFSSYIVGGVADLFLPGSLSELTRALLFLITWFSITAIWFFTVLRLTYKIDPLLRGTVRGILYLISGTLSLDWMVTGVEVYSLPIPGIVLASVVLLVILVLSFLFRHRISKIVGSSV